MNKRWAINQKADLGHVETLHYPSVYPAPSQYHATEVRKQTKLTSEHETSQKANTDEPEY